MNLKCRSVDERSVGVIDMVEMAKTVQTARRLTWRWIQTKKSEGEVSDAKCCCRI